MTKITVFNDTGKEVDSISLNKDIFGIEPNEQLVTLALKRQLSNARTNIAHTKLRSEVRGGGRKPFRQKGTGRARQGSSVSPINRGGGVVFGPRNVRNFTLQMPKKQRRKALFSVLSSKAKSKSIFALDAYTPTEIKTKRFVELFNKLPTEKSLLVVVDKQHEILTKSCRNIPGVKVILAQYLNIFDSLKYDKICFLKESLNTLESTFLTK